MNIRTKRGADRRWNAILRAYCRDFASGGSFGFDWPTLRLNRPEAYAELKAIHALYGTLPE